MNHDSIQKLTQIVQENLANEDFGPDQLVHEMGVSHSTLHRWLKQYTNKNISQFIREIRLKKASELLLNEELTISEVAYKVGFGSATYFNRCFHEQFGCSPGEFKKRELVAETENTQSKERNFSKKYLFIAAPILVLSILALFLVEKYDLFNNKSPIEKSIAVLPVNYLGDPQHKYLADGVCEDIQNNLAKIKDLRVVDFNSVKLYQSTKTSEEEIVEELKVGALLKITFQEIETNIVLFVRLINSDDGTVLFSEIYNSDENRIFITQSDIALAIANELEANITTEEKQRIEKIPTVSLTANDFYQRAREQQWKYWINEDQQALKNAKELYSRALEYDANFAPVYTGMALLEWNQNSWKSNIPEQYLDSVLWLAEKALSIDKNNSDAYFIKAEYNRLKGFYNDALSEYDKAIQINPNDWMAYFGKAQLFYFEDLSKTIQYCNMAASRHKGIMLPTILRLLATSYQSTGFPEKAEYYRQEALSLDFDSAQYLLNKESLQDIPTSIHLLEKALTSNSSNPGILWDLAFYNSFAANNDEAFSYLKKYMALNNSPADLPVNSMHRIAYIYYQQGMKDSAAYYFQLQEKSCLEAIESGRYYSNFLLYDLAGVYAFNGEKQKAYSWLNKFNELDKMPGWMVELIKTDPLFETIRKEPNFKEIVAEVETKYKAEHERVKVWLENNHILLQ
ncbi:helix-turn-helix domain-containing protein [uncultured Draconibacterium sp.]|uniref:helix-turn-helix domain-containing protein n=1 Tax=uncultured Draconibacterium sp. TaxID=1573823 RepID=UPI0025E569E8|nr:helix-turn-helix domain-containing protein [uncultured Draconibacterium sp.]